MLAPNDINESELFFVYGIVVLKLRLKEESSPSSSATLCLNDVHLEDHCLQDLFPHAPEDTPEPRSESLIVVEKGKGDFGPRTVPADDTNLPQKVDPGSEQKSFRIFRLLFFDVVGIILTQTIGVTASLPILWQAEHAKPEARTLPLVLAANVQNSISTIVRVPS